MGNQPSSEAAAYGKSTLFVLPPSHADRPLPPLPPLSTHASHISHISHYSHASASSFPTSASASASLSASAQKLSKPRIRSTAGLLKSPDVVDAKATGSGSRRFSTAGIAHLVAASFSSPNTPTTSSFAGASSSSRRRSSSRPRALPLPPPSLLPPSPGGAQSPSVFTFEEAVVAVTGQQNPAAWRPPVSSVYPSPSLDLELLQEQQARQLEFELRQRQSQLQFQKLQWEAQKLQRDRERELRRYSSYEFGLYDQAITDAEFDDEDGNEDELIERGRQQLRLLKQRQKQKERSRRRSSFFRSKSSQRTSIDLDRVDDRDYRDFRDYTRRNSIGSVYRGAGDRTTWDIGSMTYDQVLGQYYGGPLSENWPPQAGSRTSWNYDMSSYAAKRLLHLVDDNPLDNKFEQGSVASESRYSMVSEVTWKSSHPVRPESPTLTRANSDLSVYAPVRRTSIVQVPGVATRRNSTSSFASAGGASMRPTFRHSHPATTPSLSRRTSFESTGSRVMSMPPLELQRPELGADNTVEETARVSTPPDGEYNTIGTFKLGSLRITNGAESPMSSPETKRTRKEKKAKEESARSPTLAAEERTRALAALSATTPIGANTENNVTITTSNGVTDENDSGRHISPLSPALFQPPVELFAGIVPKPVIIHELPAREPVVCPSELPQIELTQDLFADFEFSSFSFEDTVPVPVTVVEPPSIPQSTLLPLPTTLQTTSKSTAVEDLLFEEDDHSTSGYADPEILDVRLDPNAKASPNRGKAGTLAARESAHSMQSVSRSDSGFVSSPTSESSSRKALSKADSGYSSNVSLRSFKQAASKLMNSGSKSANRLSAEKDAASAPNPERQSFVIDELQLPSPTINTPDMAFRSMSPATTMRIKRKPLPSNAAVVSPPAPQRNAPLPPPPSGSQTMSPENMSRDALPLSPVSMSMTDTSTPATSESSAPGATTNKKRSVPSPLDNLRPAANSDSQPSPATSPIPLTPASVRSNGSVSAHSIGSGTQRPSKLLRFLSFANVAPNVAPANKGPPAMHVTHIEDDGAADIPSVPTIVNEKLREHTGLFPMTTKRLALKTQMSRDTLKTIFSVGSLETRSSSDLHSKVKEDSSRAPHRRNTFQAPSSLVSVAAAAVMPLKAVTKRKSRLSMAVDFTDEFEEEDLAQEAHEHQYVPPNTVTPEPIPDSKEKKARRSWLRWGKDGERQTPSPENTSDDDVAYHAGEQEQGANAYDDSGYGTSQLHRTPSRSSSIISRTMSLTAQLERSLSMKITFPKISISRPSTSDRPTIPISAFSTAFNNSLPISPSLPSPLFAEAMEQQRRAMTPETLAAASPPVSARMQQIRPSVLRVPPSLRPQSRPSSEDGGRRISRPSSQDNNAAAAQYYQVASFVDSSQISGAIVASPPPIDSPLQSLQPYMDVPRQRRGSLDYSHQPHRSLSGNDTHMAFVAAGGKMFMSHGGGGSQDGQPRVIRHRASFNGYSSGPEQLLDDGNYVMPQPNQQPRRNPPRMSNGYTGTVIDPFGGGHRRSGSASSTGSDKYQIQQQQAWDFYYHQYARPPPNVARGSHHRNRSMGSRHGPVPGPQAPYRILHSYNSPAYRGVPIWG
ncbi:hypothetical protein Sste5346_009633 [Sporothrix stenoceras]|uniref:Proteophosphoglycan ppg4 n=1 Tax=Sporothrix stenoceras TaxID=5173 RepID=A0ABR3YJ11_9PEZI